MGNLLFSLAIFRNKQNAVQNVSKSSQPGSRRKNTWKAVARWSTRSLRFLSPRTMGVLPSVGNRMMKSTVIIILYRKTCNLVFFSVMRLYLTYIYS